MSTEITAMQELIDFINDGNNNTAYDINEMALLLLSKEKEQIMNAWRSGLNENPKGNSENYYNETYINQ